jgi:glucan biosynthesis protein C
MHSPVRLHSMDNLRALAMLAGVIFHAALAYSPLAHPLFPTADRQSSLAVDVFAWFLHLFRMPLFFVVAGYFTAMQVRRGGIGAMLRNRLLRVGLPFVLFLPLVHVALARSTLHAARTAAHPSPLLELISKLMQSGDLDGLPPGTGHLWFLYYLMFFCVLVWVARNLGVGRWLPAIAAHPRAWLLVVLPLLLVPALASVPAPHPAPESLLPQFWAFGYYGPFFVLGFVLNARPEVLDRVRAHVPLLTIASVALYAWFASRLLDPAATPGFAAASPGMALLEACIGAWMTLACLCAGQALLARANAWLRYLADASYWTYLVHLPVLFAIQYPLMDSELHWSAKFALSVLLTLAACLLGYRLLVQPTPLARLLGRRAAAPVPAAGFKPGDSRPAAP